MLDFLFKKKNPKDFLEYNSETNEIVNNGTKTILLIIDDAVANNEFETHIAPGEKLGLKDGMTMKYAKFKK